MDKEIQEQVIRGVKGVFLYSLKSGQLDRESELLLANLVRTCDTIIDKICNQRENIIKFRSTKT